MKAELKGLPALENRLSEKPRVLMSALATYIGEKLDELENYIISEKLSGQVLNMRSGKLKESVNAEILNASDTHISGRVWHDSTVAPYGKIHETGGVINHPGSNKFQAWQGATGMIFTSFTRAHEITIPARPWFYSSWGERKEDFLSGLEKIKREAMTA